MHLVGFIIRIQHDARSHECQSRESLKWLLHSTFRRLENYRNAGRMSEWSKGYETYSDGFLICRSLNDHTSHTSTNKLQDGPYGVRIKVWRRVFLFSKVFRPALGPNQFPIQWVTAFVPGVKAAGACSRQLTPIWCRG